MTHETELDIRRIPALTDAAFAVAMTILILEIKIPQGLQSAELSDFFFDETLPELIVYIIGFVTLGVFWIGSHFHHHHIEKTDRTSSWCNILFLMLICIIPFSIGFIRNYKHESISLVFYGINLLLASAVNYFMLWYAWKKKYIKPYFSEKHFTHAKHRILIPMYIYAGIILISFFSTGIALYLFLLPVVLHIIPEKGNKLIQS